MVIMTKEHANADAPRRAALDRLCGVVKPAFARMREGVLAVSIVVGCYVPVQAEPWNRVGAWVIAGTPHLGGCALATKYPAGGFLSLTVVADATHGQWWEIVVSNPAWTRIEAEALYPIDLKFQGGDQLETAATMRGFKAPMGSPIITNALVYEFAGDSDFYRFMADGFAQSPQIELSANGQVLGSIALSDAKLAWDELLKCFVSRAQFKA